MTNKLNGLSHQQCSLIIEGLEKQERDIRHTYSDELALDKLADIDYLLHQLYIIERNIGE